MFELFITATVLVMSATFAVGLVFLLRAVQRQTQVVIEFSRILREVIRRVTTLEVINHQTEEHTIEIELKHLETMERLLSVLHKVQTKQNELILKAAGFNREEVMAALEKQTNDGIYALLEELGTVQSLRANVRNGKQQGEREESSAGLIDPNRSKDTR